VITVEDGVRIIHFVVIGEDSSAEEENTMVVNVAYDVSSEKTGDQIVFDGIDRRVAEDDDGIVIALHSSARVTDTPAAPATDESDEMKATLPAVKINHEEMADSKWRSDLPENSERPDGAAEPSLT